jgi:hypothetical protein
LSKFFRKKLRMPPLVDPWAVEIDIFADLTISKEAKSSIFALTVPLLDPFCTLQSSAAAAEGQPKAGELPESSGQDKSSSAEKPRLADIFRTENLRTRAVLLIIIW